MAICFGFLAGSAVSSPWYGYKGQYVCVDPISKLVMVQTALDAPGADRDIEAWSLWAAIVEQHGNQR